MMAWSHYVIKGILIIQLLGCSRFNVSESIILLITDFKQPHNKKHVNSLGLTLQKIQNQICCCCLVASVVSNFVRPHRQQPTTLRRPWDSPGKNTAVGCHFLLQCMKVKSESEVVQSCPTLYDPMDCSLPDSSIPDIEYLSGLPLPSPELDIRIYNFRQVSDRASLSL